MRKKPTTLNSSQHADAARGHTSIHTCSMWGASGSPGANPQHTTRGVRGPRLPRVDEINIKRDSGLCVRAIGIRFFFARIAHMCGDSCVCVCVWLCGDVCTAGGGLGCGSLWGTDWLQRGLCYNLNTPN